MMTGACEMRLWCASRLDVALSSPTPPTLTLAMVKVLSCWTMYTAVAQRANWPHATALDGGFITAAITRTLESSAQVGLSIQSARAGLTKIPIL